MVMEACAVESVGKVISLLEDPLRLRDDFFFCFPTTAPVKLSSQSRTSASYLMCLELKLVPCRV